VADARDHLLGLTEAGFASWAKARGAGDGAARAFARTMLARAAKSPVRGGETAGKVLLEAAARDLDDSMPAYEAFPDPDGTVRFAITLSDGALVETVLIAQPAQAENDESDRKRSRFTVCVSSQVGCARGCVFCETGRLGFVRNLAAWEIVAQFAIAADYLKTNQKLAPDNVVFMGMGEPLDNLEAVLQSIAVLREQSGFAVPERRITVSTVGIVPRMDELYARTKANLAVSLHALEEKSRVALLPIAKKFDLATLRAAIARAPRTVLLQWTLIEGQNDSDEDADRLAKFCEGLDARVNLIPLNPGPLDAQRAPPLERCRAFQKRLADAGVRALLRLPHGQQVGGACGQLAGARRDQGAGAAPTT
jgi:23S rRNA (adenine2503-C2)-methyltransferase